MKALKIFFGISMCISMALPALSQQVTYSQPLKQDDYRHTEFEIIGKIKAGEPAQDSYSTHILVYKNNDGEHKIAVYAPDMKLIGNVQLKFLTDGLLSVNFLTLSDHFIMVYQYQNEDYVYCKALLFNGNGRVLKDPVLIDSSQVGKRRVKSGIYTIIHSDDRSRILVYKINQDKDFNNVFYTFSYDNELNFLRNSRLELPMKDKNAFLAEFSLSNEGHFFFVKESRQNQNSNVDQVSLVVKNFRADTFSVHPYPLKRQYLEKVKLKTDHKNKRIYAAALYTGGRKGDVEGLFAGEFSLDSNAFSRIEFRPFTESFLQESQVGGSAKTAFNNYFIRDLIVRGDGGFLVVAENYYTTSNANDWNRWNYMYGPYGLSPYYSPYYSPYSYYSPYYSPYYYSPFNSGRDEDVYHYNDIAILSYDSSLNLSWSNFIRKSQQSKSSNISFLSYKIVNISSRIMFLYNTAYRKSYLLTANSIDPGGKLDKLPTLRGLDNGYQWMPRFGRQIGPRSVIVPCYYHNYICFARIVF